MIIRIIALEKQLLSENGIILYSDFKFKCLNPKILILHKKQKNMKNGGDFAKICPINITITQLSSIGEDTKIIKKTSILLNKPYENEAIYHNMLKKCERFLTLIYNDTTA